MRKNIYLFMGPPGSGKGSLSKLCEQNLGWQQFSTGNLCRQHIAEQTEIGKQIDFAIKSGKLVSDELVTAMVGEWLHENIPHSTGVILDGFPRTIAQARSLDSLLQEKFKDVQLTIIKLLVSDDHIVMRLAERYVCQNNNCQAVYSMIKDSTLRPKKESSCDECSSKLIRRSDDNQDAVLERLKTYYAHEKDLLSFYQEKGQSLNEINVAQPLSMVFDNVKNLVADLASTHDYHKK